MAKSFLRKWLGLIDAHITRAEVEAMLVNHFAQVEEYLTSKIEKPKLVETKQPTTRVRNFSQFRDKVEASVFSEK